MRHKTCIATILSLCSVCLVLQHGRALAATYYVDANGCDADDGNPGTSNAPWKTMARAMQNWSGAGTKVRPGDTVILRDGDYGKVEFNYSYGSAIPQPGSWNDRIAYKAADGAVALFRQLTIRGDYHRYLEFDGVDVIVRTPKPNPEVYSELHGVFLYASKSIRLKNMNISGYPDSTIKRFLTTAGVMISFNAHVMEDILVEGCDIAHTLYGIVIKRAIRGEGIVFRNNTIHDIPGHAILTSGGTRGRLIIEGNTICDDKPTKETYYIKCSESPVGKWGRWDVLTQDKTGAKAVLYRVNTETKMIYIEPINEIPFEAGPDKIIRGPQITCTPAEISHIEYIHTAGIALRNDNIEIRNNTVRRIGGTASIVAFENQVGMEQGYTDLLIENNLVYDPKASRSVLLKDLGTNVTIRNNTFVGYRSPDYPRGSRNAYYYRTPFRIELRPGRNGAGIRLYNNVIVGKVEFPRDFTDYDEDYNIFYSVLQNGNYLTRLKGSHTVIYCNGLNEPRVFDSEFFVDPDYSPNHGRVCDYHLAKGSQAIGFAGPAHAPAEDMEGKPRDTQPDAGCYEYVPSTP